MMKSDSELNFPLAFAHFGQSIKESLLIFFPILKLGAGWLIGCFFLCEVLQAYFDNLNELMLVSTGYSIIGNLGKLSVALLEMAVLVTIVPKLVIELESGKNLGTFLSFSKKHAWLLFLESLRALAVIFLWTLAFIVPGLFKYLRLSFVPYVVVADKEYAEGHIDALAESNRLATGITFILFVISLGFTAIEIAQSTLREQYPLMTSPALSLSLSIPFFFINLFSNLFLFKLYQIRAKALPPPKEMA